MNIFVFHRNPAIAAKMYPPALYCSGALDIAQVLSTVVHFTDGSFYSESTAKRARLATRFFRKASYSQQAGKTLPIMSPLLDDRNPWVKWAMSSKENYSWLLRLLVSLLAVSKNRGRMSAKSMLWDVCSTLEIVPRVIVQDKKPMSPFPLVAPQVLALGHIETDPVLFYTKTFLYVPPGGFDG